LVPLYLNKLFIPKQKAFVKNGIVVSIIILILALSTTQNPIKQRFTDIIHTDPGKIELKRDTTVYDFNNLTLRLFLWKTGIQNIKEHNLWWIGAGNGDAQDLQNKKFAEYTVTDKKTVNPLIDLNMHNMYLQSLIMLGIPGLLIFIAVIFSPFIYIKYFELNYIIFFFNFIMCVFMFQESSFQTQSGIIFYSFFSMIFWNYHYSSKNIIKVKNQIIYA
jgi:O-antigen ligase